MTMPRYEVTYSQDRHDPPPMRKRIIVDVNHPDDVIDAFAGETNIDMRHPNRPHIHQIRQLTPYP